MEKNRAFDLSVYFVADPHACAGRNVIDVVSAAVAGGATMIQLRNKLDDPNIVALQALELQKILRPRRIPLIINDYVEIAKNHDGLHIGQADMRAFDARKILGPDKIIGVTAFEEDHFKSIDPDLVDYAGTGPVYETQTKPGKKILGTQGLAELIKKSPVPVVGIGGIDPGNAGAVIKAGAHGVAMMRSVSESADPAKAARSFAAVVRSAKTQASI